MASFDLKEHLRRFGQEHLLRWESELSTAAREVLHRQIAAIDFEQLSKLAMQAKQPAAQIDVPAVQPIPALSLGEVEPAAVQAAEATGLEALRQGRVAAVLVAGGQGSRLGFEHPKGMFPIGPVQQTPLFQIHAERIRAWSRRVGQVIPWYIMTSPTNNAETIDFFRAHQFFGLEANQVRFFIQGTMPAVDIGSGRVLLAEKGSVFTSPNGHGGTLLALREEGLLDDMARRGIDLVYYFQVDNVFVKVLDPVFLGHHLRDAAELSVKVIRKQTPTEKVGLVVHYQGKPTIIEYSDLPRELAEATEADGRLRYWTGSIAIHVFNRGFLERVTKHKSELPFHTAFKKVPALDAAGTLVDPKEPNAIKFEMFIFDVMPLARQVCVVETDAEEEYAPLKNATGEYSPDWVRSAMTKTAGKWLRAAGVPFPSDAAGNPAVPLEISPLAGLDVEEFVHRLRRKDPITGPTYFGPATAGDG